MTAMQPQVCALPPVTRAQADALAAATDLPATPASTAAGWGIDTCPVCGYAKADVDPDGVLWCPACGYSKKACYT